MFCRRAVLLRAFSWRSLQVQNSRSVCGPSVLRRSAHLTLSSLEVHSTSRQQQVQSSGSRKVVRRQRGLSVLRRPAHQPGHIERSPNSRLSVGVCSGWLAGHVQQNHPMQVTSLHLQPQCLRSGSAMRVRGSSARRASVQQSPWPNPSVEATNCSKLQFAPHLERWAS